MATLNPLSTTPSAAQLPREVIFDVLSNKRRQCVLHYLKRQDTDRVQLRDVVDYVAAWENNTSIDRIESTERKRVYTALRQSHLPKLDDAGIINYKKQQGEVELTPQAEEVQVYLEYVPKHDIPWSEFYLGLSAVGMALVAAAWMGVYPFSNLTGVTLAGIVSAIFALSAAVHTYRSRQNRIGAEEFEVE